MNQLGLLLSLAIVYLCWIRYWVRVGVYGSRLFFLSFFLFLFCFFFLQFLGTEVCLFLAGLTVLHASYFHFPTSKLYVGVVRKGDKQITIGQWSICMRESDERG